MQWWALGGLCAVILATACSGLASRPLRPATAGSPVPAGIEQVTLMTGEGGDARTFACGGILKSDPPQCLRMFEVRSLDWSTLPVTIATGDGLRVSAPVDLRGRFDGCALQVEEAKPSGTRRSMVIPRFEASESFADVGTALKVAEAIEEEPALCNGDLSPLLGWGADGRTVEIEVVWADSPRVDRLRRLYGPVTVVSKLSPL